MKPKYNFLKNLSLTIFLTIILVQLSCKKDWLDAKPNKALVVPGSIADYQAILDNNTGTTLFNSNGPSLTEVGAGDFYLQYSSWQQLSNGQERNAYLWNVDIYAGETSFDWDNAYQRILNENIVLDGIAKVTVNSENKAGWNNVKGIGLFYRAFDFWGLAQEFAKAYDPGSASTDLGIPLRVTSDITVKSVRASVQATYDQIINDLLTAKMLLPDTGLFPTRPGKWAVYGLLARVYLSASNYDKAFQYADSCLKMSNGLIDYNALSPSSSAPIPRFNKEVIFHDELSSYSAFDNYDPWMIVDSTLYNSYGSNDLRKQLYFITLSGLVTYNATYSGDYNLFGGLATDEMYLIRAECYARQNNLTASMADLDSLLVKRYITGTYTAHSAVNAADALSQVLAERRKELVYRGLRWTDLKRLNKDPLQAITLTRILNGQTYSLPANSNLYVFPIPPDEIAKSGIPQNPR